MIRIDWMAALIAIGPHVLAALAVLFGFWLLWRVTRPAFRRIAQRAELEPALIRLLVDNLYKGVLGLFAVVTAASQLGVNVAAALAGLGVAGIAVGFAAQETVANMIAGFLIFWDRPFRVGDYVTTQGRYGQIAEITMRTTRIRTQEHTYVVLPNKQIIGDLLVNHSMYGSMRVNIPVGIAYKETVSAARAVLLEAARGLPGVAVEPAPAVVATGFGDSSVNLELRLWVTDAALEQPLRYAAVEAAKMALDRAGIEIPFPHLQLFVEDVRDAVWKQLRSKQDGE